MNELKIQLSTEEVQSESKRRSSVFGVPQYNVRCVEFLSILACQRNLERYIDNLLDTKSLKDTIYNLDVKEFDALVNTLIYDEMANLVADKELLVSKVTEAFLWMQKEYEEVLRD